MTKNIEIARQLYASSSTGDVNAILDLLHDDVSWGITSVSSDVVPPHGIFQGKTNALKFFQGWGQSGEFKRFEARDFVAAGDHVFALLQYEYQVKATGKVVKNGDCLQHFTFKDGKIIRWRGYEDTAATRDAFSK